MSSGQPKKYHTIGMGGTFDRLHLGHQKLLQFAAERADNLYIGITPEEMNHDKTLSTLIQPYAEREQSVIDFLRQVSPSTQVTMFPLQDPYGPTLAESLVEAVAVTEHTRAGGEAINRKRQELSLPLLPIEVCSLVKDESGEYISSSRIRQGLINRSGSVYTKVLEKDVVLSQAQRQFFGQKQGSVVTQPSDTAAVRWVVGDYVLATFLKNSWSFQLGVFDGKNEHREFHSEDIAHLQPALHVNNPAGIITPALVQALQDTLINQSSKNLLLFVEGEEDLAAVALALLAPLHTHIYYGQRGEGMIEMVITEDLKNRFFQTLTAAE